MAQVRLEINKAEANRVFEGIQERYTATQNAAEAARLAGTAPGSAGVDRAEEVGCRRAGASRTTRTAVEGHDERG